MPCFLKMEFVSPRHCTEMHFANFLSSGFSTMAVMNPPESKLAKRTSVHCRTGLFWAVGTAEKKNANCQKYATFEGSFLIFFKGKFFFKNFKNIVASALKS